MNATRHRLILATAAALILPASVAAAPSECDEACLVSTAQDFLGAVAESDPSLLDWNAYARWTLNGIELPWSEAVWALENSVSDAHRIIVPDVEAGQVGIITTWTFDGTPSLMAARLSVEWGRLSGAELIVVTQPAPPPTPPGTPRPPAPPGPQFAELGAAAPAFSAGVASPASRAELIAIANAYFDGVAAGEPAYVAADCAAMENANAASCGAAGLYGPAVEIAPRRFIADPARGMVFAIVRYSDDGVASKMAPASTLAAQALKIEGGAVTAVEGVGERVHYYLPTGWDEE